MSLVSVEVVVLGAGERATFSTSAFNGSLSPPIVDDINPKSNEKTVSRGSRDFRNKTRRDVSYVYLLRLPSVVSMMTLTVPGDVANASN